MNHDMRAQLSDPLAGVSPKLGLTPAYIPHTGNMALDSSRRETIVVLLMYTLETRRHKRSCFPHIAILHLAI